MESGPCSRYLSVLIELGIIKKETPLTERPGKRTIYTIEDNFFRFWYRFVPGNLSMISSGRFPPAYPRLVKAKMHEYMGLIFEKMCKEYLLRYAEDLPFELAEVGQWWGTDPADHKQIQIDIVGAAIQDPDQHTNAFLIGSCKFRNELVDINELDLIERYAHAFSGQASFAYMIFSLSGFTDRLKEAAAEGRVRLVTLADMYELK